jgi:RND family efflux transporter MFP subunit
MSGVESDLSRLRIDREGAPRHRWLPWAVVLVVAAAAAVAYPSARSYVAERRAPQVDVARATQVVPSPGGSLALPVLVASGYVVARHSSEVGVKTGGRILTLGFEEGTRVRKGAVIAQLEHADIEAQLEAARRTVAEADAALVQNIAQRDEDVRNVERQRALAKDGITTDAALTAAEAAAAVSAARVTSAAAAIESARARVRVAEEALENTNVRAPFDGIVIKKRAEVGETVSPFGVAGQSAREGGAIATIADLAELEVQTEVSENGVAKLSGAMPAEVRLQAYPDRTYAGRLRQIFPSADRAKAIVEVRVTILNADERVKPEMTASVTFQEPPASTGNGRVGGRGSRDKSSGGKGPPDKSAGEKGPPDKSMSDPVDPIVLIPKRVVSEDNGQSVVWVVIGTRVKRRTVSLGADRLDQVEVKSGVAPGEILIVNAPPGLTDGALVRVKVK